jgi:hypothetical protein
MTILPPLKPPVADLRNSSFCSTVGVLSATAPLLLRFSTSLSQKPPEVRFAVLFAEQLRYRLSPKAGDRQRPNTGVAVEDLRFMLNSVSEALAERFGAFCR